MADQAAELTATKPTTGAANRRGSGKPHALPNQQVLEGVDAVFRSLVDDGAAPGVAYGVVGTTGLVHAGGHGVMREAGATPDGGTAFRIASMTKSFTAAAVMLLLEAGAMQLADPISRYVPEFSAVRLPTLDSPEPTIGMLLSMSGGLPIDNEWADRQESISRAAFGRFLTGGIRFVSVPGTAYEYSNLGFAAVGSAIEAASGMSFHDFVRRHLVEPLGLSATGFDASVPAPTATGYVKVDGQWQPMPISGPGVFSAIGGLFSTVDDLAGWVAWLADAFPARDDADSGPLPRAARREMQQLHRLIPPTHGQADPAMDSSGYGYGLVVQHHPTWGPIISHSGGYPGFGSHMRWHAESGWGIISLTNARYVTGKVAAAAALAEILADVTGPSTDPDLWPETVAAQLAVERLLRRWDASIVDAWFSDNVAQDLDLSYRRAQIERLVRQVGPLSAVTIPGAGVRSDSAAHVVWRVGGAQGRLRCEISLTPQNPPKIQTLSVTVDNELM